MKRRNISRRKFVGRALGGAGLLSAPSLLYASEGNSLEQLNIVCVGAHPDDPESGCGGTLTKFSNAGHNVTIVYLTRGEAGIPGKTNAEAAAIRTKEAEAACMLLKAKPIFAGQIDGDTVVDSKWTAKIHQIIKDINPNIVFTHWPLDTHRDHQAAGTLAFRAWLQLERIFDLYYFEVCRGEQTLAFHPTDYVDITTTQQVKRKAVFCHESQDPPGIYSCGHAAMEEFRGREINVRAAEAFVRGSISVVV
jgi:N-acetylglucosamine malate deacetylase 1